MSQPYRLINDPIFYVTVVIFTLLTTALPAILGQPIFLPIAQTVSLFAFITIPLHQRLTRQTLWVVGLWLVTQFLVILILTVWAEQRVQQAFANGFLYRMAYVEWFYGGMQMIRPDSFAARPWAWLIEFAGVTLGALFTMGIVGIWFLVRAVNLAAFSMGAILLASGETKAFIGGLPLWSLIRIGGYAGLVVVLAEPLLTSNWAVTYYLRERRQLLLISVALAVGGLLLELILPNFWRTLFR